MIDGRINLKRIANFGFHRDGWNAATDVLRTLHSPKGIAFYDWLDREYRDKTNFSEPWVGILHNPLTFPDEYPHKYKRLIPLTRLVQTDHFRSSLRTCRGIFCLSRHTANFMRRNTHASVEFLPHPIRPVSNTFSLEKYSAHPTVAMIGQWMRRYHSFFYIKTDSRKVIPRIAGFKQDYEQSKKYADPGSVEWLGYLENHSYDQLLQASVVFLDLYDAAACNVVLECIVRNTPILINLLPAIVEYLGPKYPFYYQSLEEAEVKINDTDKIWEATEYLKKLDKSQLSPERFKQKLVESEIYKSLQPREIRFL